MPRPTIEAQPAFTSEVVYEKLPKPTRAADVRTSVIAPDSSTTERPSSAVLVVEGVEVTTTDQEPETEQEGTASPDNIAFEPDFDLRDSASPVSAGLLNIFLAALVYKLHQVLFL